MPLDAAAAALQAAGTGPSIKGKFRPPGLFGGGKLGVGAGGGKGSVSKVGEIILCSSLAKRGGGDRGGRRDGGSRISEIRLAFGVPLASQLLVRIVKARAAAAGQRLKTSSEWRGRRQATPHFLRSTSLN